MINFGNISIADLRLGSVQVKAAYLGNKQIWSGEEPGPTAEPLCFTLESTTFKETISLDKTGSPDTISLEYSTDGNTWSDYTWDGNAGLAVNLDNNGDKVYFRAKNENQTINSNSMHYYMFSATGWSGVVRISGNIQTLLKADGSRTDAPAYCYYALFSRRPDWKSAPDLPATTLAEHCYDGMFVGSSGLTSAPELPATTLADSCYYRMFEGCTSLTSAPAILPATTLANYCYANMFYNCQALTTAPALPATTLAEHCYQNMFYQCTSLAAAPVLPAMILAPFCYQSMFYNCRSLTTAPELPATTLATQCYERMFDSCRYLTSAPVLPATTMAYGCYSNMFNSCQALTTAPELPSTSLTADFCYNSMFAYCYNLSSIAVQFTSWTGGNNPTGSWLTSVAATGTFTCPAELSDIRDASHIPEGWTKVDLPGVGSTKFKINGAWRSVDIVGELTQADVPSGTLTEVEIGENVTSLGSDAFREQSNLTAVTMPNTLSSIGSSSFYQTAITDISVPNSVQSIELGAFSGCRQLSSITLGNVATIGVQAFYNCSALTSMTIPSQTTSIGFQTFTNCSNLLDMTFTGKTTAQVQGMTNYSWMLPTGCTIHCTDGDITL